MEKYEYDPSNLKALIEATGMSEVRIAEATGVSHATLRNALSGDARRAPSITTLMALADYFAVPLDFIVGRCEKELAEEVLEDYSRRFMELRRAPFEAYLLGRRPEASTTYGDGKAEAPWPYNLLDALFGAALFNGDTTLQFSIIGDDREDDIVEVLDTLDARSALALTKYYRDGLTLEKISQLPEFNVTKGRVADIINAALRTLRHGSYANMLRYGKENAAKMSVSVKKQAELREEERVLALWEKQIERKREELGRINSEVARQAARLKLRAEELPGVEVGATVFDPLTEKDVLLRPIEALGLGQRAMNSLWRHAGCRTMGDVLNLARDGRLLRISNLGVGCAREILTRLEELTGEDLWGRNSVSRPPAP